MMHPRSSLPMAALLLASCISSNPAFPAVRWFDPTPTGGPLRQLQLQIAALPFLGQQFVLRTGPRELVVDEMHRWVAAPEQLVRDALERTPSPATGDVALLVRVTRFEFDLTAAPRAVVGLTVQRGEVVAEVRGEATSAGSDPEQLADAMARALADAAVKVGAVGSAR